MTNNPKYLLIEASVAPEVFVRVVRAKQLIAQGRVTSSSQAARMAGISRSAFYKYKDFVHRYDEHLRSDIISLNVVLEDEPGVLSNVLAQLYKARANIITVNQNIPVDGVAQVSVAVRLSAGVSAEQVIAVVSQIAGVVKVSNV